MRQLGITLALFLLFGILHGQEQSDTIKINENLYLLKLEENAWIHVSFLNGFACNGLILVDNKKAFLFDTPSYDSITTDLIRYIQDTLELKIIGFITNDWHIDSQGGLNVINGLGIPTYSNELTREIAKSKGLPYTSNGFKDSLEIDFESMTIELFYFGAAHTLDNIVAWIPEKQILFADCMIKELSQNNLGFTGDGDINAYPETLRKVGERFSNAKFVVPGHGKSGGYDLITHTLDIANKK
jgi:metallo-beta-lactamase class B